MDARQAGEPRIGDAFGQALLDYLEHGPDGRGHFIEWDDGLLEAMDPGLFFTGESEWSAVEEAVSERAGPRVLDVGAGAGRQALPSRKRGTRWWRSTSLWELSRCVDAVECGRLLLGRFLSLPRDR